VAIKFKCPACGHREIVPDELAGERVDCPQCGSKIRLPAATKATAPTDAASAQVDEPLSSLNRPADPVSQATEPSSLPGYVCSVCRQSFDVTDVYEQQGAIICKSCFAAQQRAADEGQGAGDESLDEPIACAGCGAAVPPGQIEEWDGQLLCSTCATLAAARPISPVASVRKAPPAKRSSSTAWIVAAAVTAVAGAAIVIALKFSPRSNGTAVANDSTSDAAPKTAPYVTPSVVAPGAAPALTSSAVLPQLVALRRQGLEQESANDLRSAAATYGQLVHLGQAVANPSDALKQQLATARSALASVNERLNPAGSGRTTPSNAHPATESFEAVAVAKSPAPSEGGTSQSPPVPAPSGDWEQQHAGQIRTLLNEAESRLAANDSFKATLIYQQLFQLVGPHLSQIRDAELKRRVAAAATTRGRLLVQLKSSPQSVSLTADTLLASGLAALQESHWQAGLESLSDVRALFEKNVKLAERARDPKYLMALDAMAVAYLKTNQTPKAGELFDETAPLGKAVDRDPTRDMVVNRAAVDLIQHTKAMRAAKSLETYLQKHPGDAPDEELLNLLGTSLFIAEQHTMGKSKLEEYAVIYKRANDRLEKTRPGEKRWGVEWLSANEVDRKMAERQQALTESANLSRQAANAYDQWQRLQELYNSYSPGGVRRASAGQVLSAERSYNNYASSARAAASRIPDMPWLKQFDPVIPPMPGGVTAVATAAPGSSAGDAGASVFTIPSITLHEPPARPATPPPSTDSPGDSAPPPPPSATKPPMHIAAQRHALAFPIDRARLISSAEVVGDAKQVRLEDAQGQTYAAHVLARQDALVLLELDAGQPQFATYLTIADSFTGGPVSCSCVPQENVFGPQPASLKGEAVAPPAQGAWSVSLADHPRLPGSPLLNEQRQVVGVVIAKRDDVRTRLPAVSLAVLREFLSANSALAARPSAAPDPMNVLELTVQEN
jgi:ribosomal protein S27E